MAKRRKPKTATHAQRARSIPAALANTVVGGPVRRTPRPVMVRFTEEEFQRVQAAAATESPYLRQSLSQFCRRLVLVGLDGPTVSGGKVR